MSAPFSSAARSVVRPSSIAGSGTTSPWTCSRAMPPSGKMFNRTWVNLRAECTLNSCRALPVSGARGMISRQSQEPASSSDEGYPATEHPSAEQACGKLPRKNAVSTTMERTTPGIPSRTITQSLAVESGYVPSGPRRRLVSQPSYTCPLASYFSGTKTGSAGSIRFSLAPKNSSLAATTDPRSRSKSGRSCSFIRRSSPFYQPPNWRFTLTFKQRCAAQPRLPHASGQRPPGVRGDRVPVIQPGGVYDIRLVGVEGHQVGVAPDRQPPLGRQAGQPGRGRRHPPGDVVQRPAAASRDGPYRGQAELERGDTAPGRAEIPRAERLQLGRARRVIRHHAVD